MMVLTRDEIDARLLLLEIELPFMSKDIGVFSRRIEERIRLLITELRPGDEAYLMNRVNEMVKRAGRF